MSVFRIVELVGTSTESISDAVKNAVEIANKEKQLSWFEVKEQRGRTTQEGKIEFQVTVKAGIKN